MFDCTRKVIRINSNMRNIYLCAELLCFHWRRMRQQVRANFINIIAYHLCRVVTIGDILPVALNTKHAKETRKQTTFSAERRGCFEEKGNETNKIK